MTPREADEPYQQGLTTMAARTLSAYGCYVNTYLRPSVSACVPDRNFGGQPSDEAFNSTTPGLDAPAIRNLSRPIPPWDTGWVRAADPTE